LPDDRPQLVGIVGNDPARQFCARQFALFGHAFFDGGSCRNGRRGTKGCIELDQILAPSSHQRCRHGIRSAAALAD
jgi:hypothetical protein